MLTIMLLLDDAEFAGGKPLISWTVADTESVLASFSCWRSSD